MAITEETRNDLYHGLTGALGKQRATTLMEHLPPLGWGDVATKQDLQLLRTELSTEIRGVRSELQAEIGGVRSELQAEIGGARSELQAEIGGARSELQAEIGGLRAEMRVGFAELRTELHKTLRVHTLAMMAMMLTSLGIVAGLVRLTA